MTDDPLAPEYPKYLTREEFDAYLTDNNLTEDQVNVEHQGVVFVVLDGNVVVSGVPDEPPFVDPDPDPIPPDPVP